VRWIPATYAEDPTGFGAREGPGGQQRAGSDATPQQSTPTQTESVSHRVVSTVKDCKRLIPTSYEPCQLGGLDVSAEAVSGQAPGPSHHRAEEVLAGAADLVPRVVGA
jgi:hypothetical protein